MNQATLMRAVADLVGRPHRVPDRVRPALADGGPGLVLAYAQLDRCLPNRGWREMAEGYLAATVAGAERLGGTGASPGMFGGLAGIAFAAWSLTHDPGVLPEIHESVVRQAITRAVALDDQPAGRALDVISGLAGTGAYLLCRRDEPDTREALTSVLRRWSPPETAGEPAWRTARPVRSRCSASLPSPVFSLRDNGMPSPGWLPGSRTIFPARRGAAAAPGSPVPSGWPEPPSKTPVCASVACGC